MDTHPNKVKIISPSRRFTISGELPTNSNSSPTNCSKIMKPSSLLKTSKRLDSLLEDSGNPVNLSTPLRRIQQDDDLTRNTSLPNLKKVKRQLGNSLRNPLASQVMDAVQNCSMLSLPWSKVNKVYLPQLVWPEELFSEGEQENLENEMKAAGGKLNLNEE
ncbi:unnamed protein product [Hermetia illucens]|uniref:Uncharacterized protein n=1 Tax=Hermetia illucens TaxID=343691 RepID=A0A7R8V484_HERIL|nr:unnamed protein product [Hermetia illucens]